MVYCFYWFNPCCIVIRFAEYVIWDCIYMPFRVKDGFGKVLSGRAIGIAGREFASIILIFSIGCPSKGMVLKTPITASVGGV